MLRVLSSPRRLCTGLTRRELLEVGGTGLLGLSLPQLLASDAARADDAKRVPDRATGLPDGFGSAKRCIILFLYGSPSQMETVDMKPHAPAEIRGTMLPIGIVASGIFAPLLILRQRTGAAIARRRLGHEISGTSSGSKSRLCMITRRLGGLTGLIRTGKP